MEFYNREQELQLLNEIRNRSKQKAQMTFIVGRRRIGKTRLILKSVENHSFLYLFVARKNEKLLCEEYTEEIKNKLNIPVFGQITTFKDIFSLLLEYSKKTNFSLIIDEFQEFSGVNPAIYSEMQNLWDINKNNSKMNLILCGSVYSLMVKIFENAKKPLFGRATERMHLQAFKINTLHEILNDNLPYFSPKDMLAFYIFTGGVAKYTEIFTDKNALSFDAMLDEIFRQNSYFLSEGKNMLIMEFGKEYATYFSILSLIASSKTSRSEIESILEKNIGGFLERLEKEYNIIKKVKPILAKEGGRLQKYYIDDNFLNFWFRFIYKYRSAIEIENFDYVKNIVIRDFESYSGRLLEKYFVEKLKLSQQYSKIGSYWERGNKNEIDIIAFNEAEKRLLIAEVKLNPKKINLEILKQKSLKIVSKFTGYEVKYKGFSLEDV